MKFETILYEVKDEILTITLNRPDRLNAWTLQMLNNLLTAFDHADADDGIGAIVITGAGRGFCAGADLSEGAGSTFEGAENQPDLDELGDSGGAASTAPLSLFEARHRSIQRACRRSWSHHDPRRGYSHSGTEHLDGVRVRGTRHYCRGLLVVFSAAPGWH